jgi:hypothetical protein
MKQRELEVASLEAELEKARCALDVRKDSIHSGSRWPAPTWPAPRPAPSTR